MNRIQDLLDSDDEFPDFYHEDRDIPAYQDDSRFDKTTAEINKNVQMFFNNVTKKEKVSKKRKSNLVMKGVLDRRDILCLQSISEVTSNETFVWFVKFLIGKDLQSYYNFPKSCLVTEFLQSTYTDNFEIRQDIKQKFILSIKQ